MRYYFEIRKLFRNDFVYYTFKRRVHILHSVLYKHRFYLTVQKLFGYETAHIAFTSVVSKTKWTKLMFNIESLTKKNSLRCRDWKKIIKAKKQVLFNGNFEPDELVVTWERKLSFIIRSHEDSNSIQVDENQSNLIQLLTSVKRSVVPRALTRSMICRTSGSSLSQTIPIDTTSGQFIKTFRISTF